MRIPRRAVHARRRPAARVHPRKAAVRGSRRCLPAAREPDQEEDLPQFSGRWLRMTWTAVGSTIEITAATFSWTPNAAGNLLLVEVSTALGNGVGDRHLVHQCHLGAGRERVHGNH